MQITDNAKKVLIPMMEQAGRNALTFMIEGSCCHSQLLMDFVDAQQADEINGIKVVMDEQTALQLENTELDADGGRLMIRNMVSSCGCGGGCSDGCGEGGCGGNC